MTGSLEKKPLKSKNNDNLAIKIRCQHLKPAIAGNGARDWTGFFNRILPVGGIRPKSNEYRLLMPNIPKQRTIPMAALNDLPTTLEK